MTPEQPLLIFISAYTGGDESAIHAYEFDRVTGALNLIHRTTDVEHPFLMTLSPDKRFLYTNHSPGGFGKGGDHVAAYEIVGRTGELKLLNRQPTGGMAACYTEIDATARTVLVAHYDTGDIMSLPVRDDGSLGEVASVMTHEGSSVNASRQECAHAHCVIVSPDNRFAYAADLGIDKIMCYRLDAASAKLSPNQESFVRTPPGAGPRHLTFHPSGQPFYCINELENSITVFDHNADSGMLIERQTISTLPEDFAGHSQCADVKITPDGRFLYGTNRGHDSIAAYRIGDDGGLTLIAIESSLGKGPQNLAITPDGGMLLCANEPSHGVVVFKIDVESGKLVQVGDSVAMPEPSCILVVPPVSD
jgi:6-phosphogluconolactonase